MSIQLQQLPWNILAKVVYYALNNHQLRCTKNTRHSFELTNLSQFTPLLYTCQSWRLLVLQRFCRYARISVDCTPESLRTNLTSWPSTVMYPINEMNHLVQTVMIDIDFWSILNGRAIRLLDNSDVVYSTARTLNISFRQNELGYNEIISDPIACVLQFMDIVRKIMPRLRDVNIEHCTNYDIGNRAFFLAFKKLLCQSFETSDPTYYSPPVTDLETQVYIAPSLTSLKFAWNIYHEQTAQLIHNNAQSLKSLSLMFNHMDSIQTLVQSTSGEPIVFPNLLKLSFSCWHYLESNCKPTTNITGAFPRLQSMYLNMDYPFKDDTLFRGTSNTLEYLSMNVNTDVIEMAQKYKVFGGNKYPNLRAFRIKNINTRLMRPGAPSKAATKFALSVSSKLEILAVEDIAMEATIVPSIVEHGHMSSLQLLAIPDAFLTLSHIVVLLEQTPMLTDLHCHYTGVGTLFECVEDDQLPVVFAQKYAPLSNNFRVLQLGHWGNTDIAVVARCAMLMVIACPRFTYASVSSHLREKMRKCILELMSHDSFIQYAARFETLLYRG